MHNAKNSISGNILYLAESHLVSAYFFNRDNEHERLLETISENNDHKTKHNFVL